MEAGASGREIPRQCYRLLVINVAHLFLIVLGKADFVHKRLTAAVVGSIGRIGFELG